MISFNQNCNKAESSFATQDTIMCEDRAYHDGEACSDSGGESEPKCQEYEEDYLDNFESCSEDEGNHRTPSVL